MTNREQTRMSVPRHVYIDAGASWANTLRLHRDISPSAHNVSWEVYAFEASPLILPFLEKFTSWLNDGEENGTAPTPCVPQAGSTAHLKLYASAVGCPSYSTDVMRECMWSVFAKPLAALAPDPQLGSATLLRQRLSMAKPAAAARHAGSRTRYTLIPAGAATNDTHITVSSRPQQLIRGGALDAGGSTEDASKHLYRAPVVDIVGWILRSFDARDEVLFKIDVEGAEHAIFEELTRRGGWRLIDVLVFECHAPPTGRSCHALLTRVESMAPHLKMFEEREGRWTGRTSVLPSGLRYTGFDSLSKPSAKDIAAMVRACGLTPAFGQAVWSWLRGFAFG